MAAGYSPLRGDADFFTPRHFGRHQQAVAASGYSPNVAADLEESGVPLPRNQYQLSSHPSISRDGNGYAANSTDVANLRASLATVTGPSGAQTDAQRNARSQAEEEEAMYHLLPGFSPFDDILEPKETPSKAPLEYGMDSCYLQPPALESRPLNSTAMFPQLYPNNVEEPKARSLLPSFKTTATAASIWSTDTAMQQSPFSPSPAPADMKSRSNGDKTEHLLHQVSPFSSNGVDSRTNNAFSLQGLWDDSPVKQTSKKVSPSTRYADFDSPSLMPNGFSATTFGSSTEADDNYSPSLKSRSAIGLQFDEVPKIDGSAMASVPLPPPPGLPIIGSVAGYTNDLLSIKEIEEKMNLLREQSSGLAGDLIHQAAK